MAGLFLAILIVQSVRGVYGSATEKAWSWAIPTVLPTLLLILGTVARPSANARSSKSVDQFAFRVTLGLSAFYLLCIVATPLLRPPMTGDRSTIEIMALSNFWLGPLQGLIGLALGFFFASVSDDRQAST
jgi:hypothetical protein